MKKLLATLALSVLATTAVANPSGTWKSPAGDNGVYLEVKVAACGPSFCGTIVDVVGEGGDKSLIGKQMIWDMTPQDDGSYGGGKVWAADNDRTYNGKLALAGANTLKVYGCVLGGAICRDADFTRK